MEIPADVRSFLEEMKVPAVLSTLGRRGEPITSAVWYGIHDGDIVVSTPATRPKARNVRADARVSFIVDTKERPYRGVAIEGEAEVVEDPEHIILRAIGERYLGPVMPDWMRQRTEGQARVAIRIRATRVRPWGFER
ncbi:MAG: PPOX class F420-dependent oxidoreductase [Solimonas sp.]